jgi:Leucine-rich repeat (LRR) protein
MKKSIWCFAISVLSLPSFSQKVPAGSQPKEIPVFKLKVDSIQFAKLDKLVWTNVFSKKPTQKEKHRWDSLFIEMEIVRKKAIGSYWVYKPRFTTWDSLKTKEERKFVENLSIVNLQGDRLPIEILECENLERLELVNTSIAVIQHEIEALHELKILEIYNNRPSQRLTIETNGAIEVLIMRGDDPNYIPKKFKNLSSLSRLDLSRTKLKKVPSIRKNRKLQELLLTDNELEVLKISHRSGSLTKLDVRYNQLRKINGSIKKLKNLETLFANFNSISKVDKGMGKLTQLKYLSFYQNKLKKIPDALFHLKSLANIDLYYNQIETLDNRAKQWQNLSVLHLANNNVTQLSEALGEIKSLKEIYVYNNRITQLPESISKLTDLRVLRANDNYLSIFPRQLLRCTQLDYLDLSHNRISTIPIELFSFNCFQILSLNANPWDIESTEIINCEAKKLMKKNVVVNVDGD